MGTHYNNQAVASLMGHPTQHYDDSKLRRRTNFLVSGMLLCLIIAVAALGISIMLLMDKEEDTTDQKAQTSAAVAASLAANKATKNEIRIVVKSIQSMKNRITELEKQMKSVAAKMEIKNYLNEEVALGLDLTATVSKNTKIEHETLKHEDHENINDVDDTSHHHHDNDQNTADHDGMGHEHDPQISDHDGMGQEHDHQISDHDGMGHEHDHQISDHDGMGHVHDTSEHDHKSSDDDNSGHDNMDHSQDVSDHSIMEHGKDASDNDSGDHHYHDHHDRTGSESDNTDHESHSEHDKNGDNDNTINIPISPSELEIDIDDEEEDTENTDKVEDTSLNQSKEYHAKPTPSKPAIVIPEIYSRSDDIIFITDTPCDDYSICPEGSGSAYIDEELEEDDESYQDETEGSGESSGDDCVHFSRPTCPQGSVVCFSDDECPVPLCCIDPDFMI